MGSIQLKFVLNGAEGNVIGVAIANPDHNMIEQLNTSR
jgi:hypothetical protein